MEEHWLRLYEKLTLIFDSFENCTDSKKKIPQKEYLQDGKIAVVDQGQNLIGGYTNDREMIFAGNVPVIIFGDHTRCIKYIDFPFAQGADGIKVLKPKQFFNEKAFYYAFQTVDIPNMGLSTNMHRNQYLLSKVAMLTVLQRTILLLREVIGRFVRLPKRIPCFHSVLLRFIPERITNFFRI